MLFTEHMHLLLKVSIATITVAKATSAFSNPAAVDGMAKEAAMHDWAECLTSYTENALDIYPVGDGNRVDPLGDAVGKFAAGATPTIAELKAECIGRSKDQWEHEKQWGRVVENELRAVRSAMHTIATNPYPVLRHAAVHCAAIVDLALSIGDPKFPVAVDGNAEDAKWAGDMAAARGFCASAAKLADAKLPAFAKPFADAGLKNDKLAQIVAGLGERELRTTRNSNPDPKELAAAPVWFESMPDWPCPKDNGPSHVVRRTQFDPNGKLVTTTLSQRFCGDAPASAFK